MIGDFSKITILFNEFTENLLSSFSYFPFFLFFYQLFNFDNSAVLTYQLKRALNLTLRCFRPLYFRFHRLISTEDEFNNTYIWKKNSPIQRSQTQFYLIKNRLNSMALISIPTDELFVSGHRFSTINALFLVRSRFLEMFPNLRNVDEPWAVFNLPANPRRFRLGNHGREESQIGLKLLKWRFLRGVDQLAHG